MKLRIYLDNDVPTEVKERLLKFAEVVTARELGRQRMADELAYAQAVRDRFDLAVTCNSEGKKAFKGEALRHLACREKDLPIPVYELHEPNSNHWPKLAPRWEKHEARIKQELTDLGQKHERRRGEAAQQLERLERQVEAKRAEQERTIRQERDRQQHRGFGFEW